ncbi:hypothetical protein ACFOLD_08440 [Kocuria carniphila]|uniref:hypothetical protein n=1 Tax=Kocuria carniphila TaxID=262208 RepID=UPI0036103425
MSARPPDTEPAKEHRHGVAHGLGLALLTPEHGCAGKAFAGTAGSSTRQGGSVSPPISAGPRRAHETLKERFACEETTTGTHDERH